MFLKKQVQSNNGRLVLTLKLSGEKPWKKKYEIYQFCSQELPTRGSLRIIKVALKIKNNEFWFLLNAYYQLTWEKSNEQISSTFCNFLFLGPKMPPVTQLWANYKFSLKIWTITFIQFLTTVSGTAQKKLMTRHRENVNIGPKNDPFPPLQA